MAWSKQLSKQPQLWFILGTVGIFLLAIALRFWGLSRFNMLVFDEVYFATFANNYLTQRPFFDGHPPLGKYLIAIGIWLGNLTPWGANAVKNSLTGSLLSPFSYRWLNALVGSFIPLIVMGIAYQLTRRRSYALVAGLLSALDGLFLVESRYALVNVYLISFGLLGQWFFLRSLDRRGVKRWWWLILAGIAFGASAAVKWNGLWFLFGAYLLWFTAWIMRLVAKFWGATADLTVTPSGKQFICPLRKLTQLNPIAAITSLAVVPVLTYSLSWIPHLQLNPSPNFWDVQKRILSYHEQVGNGPKVHPYCSDWHSWFFMQRPIVYLYETAQTTSDIVPAKPPLPQAAVKVVYDIHAMGNPLLWWLSTAGILLVMWMLGTRFYNWVKQADTIDAPSNRPSDQAIATPPLTRSTPGSITGSMDLWIGVYIVVNYWANVIPWMRVSRCTFLYHYMGASVFSLLAIAWLIDRWLHSRQYWFRVAGATAIFLIILAFIFWLPLYLGLPLSPSDWQLRRWLPTW
ncbi:dolichyl-phosphate-mannose--protein mannosyltransferase [Trichocoleus sp. FACHB-262]|uniref:dolichyl-phosphate-mannose--protein mannosyltransferase n=1 Tax=Trichocoleus sp. FACHB-262 TaxID=2692869 RepID=UPI001684EB22|nr:phospholipid carrier-dependent glycosyltransferase [Trichocoleus sp. FACHB-262]MBD2121751.1 phospholipid carrier-dependent glycosyltransferase [Trichocoleus sp. FACHB-262]